MVHLLQQGRLDRQGTLTFVIETGILNRNRRFVSKGAQQPYLLIVEEVWLVLIETDTTNGTLTGA